MKNKIFIGLVLSMSILPVSAKNIDFRKELKQYSIYTDSVVNDYYSSGLIGNGFLGASVYKEKGDTLCWELGRTDVTDHRIGNFPFAYQKCRLPIGKFLIPMSGGSSDMLMDLYKSEVSGHVRNGSVAFAWRTLTPACHNVYVIELKGDELPDILFRPEVSISPRYIYKNGTYKDRMGDKLQGYGPNPSPRIYEENGFYVCKQPMLAGGEYTTVWKKVKQKGLLLLVASVAYSQSRTDTEKDAMKDIDGLFSCSLEKAEKMHLEWWRKFYSKSYISVSEERYNAFFWTQLYKLGSATRSDRLPIDLMGPWYHNNTPWPAIWWNLNIQLTYSPVFAINHSELSLPLFSMLDNHVDNLKKNVRNSPYPAAAIGRVSSYDCDRPVEKEHGLLTWTLLYYWKYCRYTMDNTRLKEKFFPLLKLAINYYRPMLYEGKDGYLHLPKSYSPEYGEAEDCNFELSLLRWGCETLIKVDEMFALDDELLPEWSRISDKLVPYPVDKDGFLIGKDVKLTSGHRHYSHLLMLYPLENFPLDTPKNKDIANRSINFWLGFKNQYYQGYTYTGSSSMAILLGDGERAYRYLNVFFDKFIRKNTLYGESGPCFETPMSALASFTEMLLSGKDGVIKIMPAVPEKWKDIKFERLLAEKGFEVSAERTDGTVKRVFVKSLYGGSCKIYPGIEKEVCKIKLSGQAKVKSSDENGFELIMPRGGTAEISRK